MSFIIALIGAILITLGLVMHATRAGYLYFVIGPRTVLTLAAVGTAGVWLLVR
jgi:hypothetical protein